jgi:D-3-phosphoglycerate dehydrogenase
MTQPKHVVIALKRDEQVEKFISEELETPVKFVELSDSNMNFEDVECAWVDMTTDVDNLFVSQFPNLKYIATPTTGITHIKLLDSQLRKFELISLKGEIEFLNEITSTAEFAWGLALAIWRRIPQAAQKYINDVGIRRDFAGLQLRNLSIGLIGFGRLGKMLSSYASGFGMRTLYFDPFIDNLTYPVSDTIIKCRTLEELCQLSDIVFLVASHDRQKESEYPILDRRHLSFLKRHVVVVNVSRGSLLDEETLAEFILEGRIFGAGIDVLSREEKGAREISQLQTLQNSGFNVLVTPHIGGMCSDAFEKTHRFTAKKLNNLLIKTKV